jgi:DNA repair exonuclease SbcCD ATPase subunit
MRKAFDANVPKLKPRLKTTAFVMPHDSQEAHNAAPHATAAASASDSIAAPAESTSAAQVVEQLPVAATPQIHTVEASMPLVAESAPEKILEFPARSQAPHEQEPLEAATDHPVQASAPVQDAEARRERLEKVKRKVAQAARTEVRIEPVPENPIQAAESVLVLVGDLEKQLERSREMEKALRHDLSLAKTELARAANESRTAVERLGLVEEQLEEKRTILEEMLVEMAALEEERDQAVRRVQTLAAQGEERQRLLGEAVQSRAEMEKSLAESKAREERLSREIDDCLTENAQLRAVLSEITHERDSLARDVDGLTRERNDLLDAKKALEKVHQALAQARARLGG